jgi:hypothetical protein
MSRAIRRRNARLTNEKNSFGSSVCDWITPVAACEENTSGRGQDLFSGSFRKKSSFFLIYIYALLYTSDIVDRWPVRQKGVAFHKEVTLKK